MNGWYAAIKVLKNALCFIMGYLVPMVIRVMLFVLVQCFILYAVQVKSMCVPILRSIGSELTKLENMQQLYILFDVTWRKNGTSYVMGTTTVLIGILTRNILKPTRSLQFKSYGSNSGFRVFSDLDLDLWAMFYFFCHTHCAWCTGISMRSFIRIHPVWMGDMLRLTFWITPYAL